MNFLSKLKKRIDFAYFRSFVLIILSIYSGLISEYLMRKILDTKVSIFSSLKDETLVSIDLSILILIKFSLISLFIFLLLLISRNGFRLYSIKANIFKGIIIVFAGHIWSKAVLITKMQIPIYMTSLVSLSIPIFVAIFSRLLLKEVVSRHRLIIITVSAFILFSALFKNILFGAYSFSIIMLLTACILYSLSDTLNIAIIRAKSNKDEPNVFLRTASRESIVAQILYTNLFAALLGVGFIFVKAYFRFMDLNLQLRCVQTIVQNSWMEVFLIAFFMSLMTSFSLFGFKLKPGSSVQYIKILEPIMAGSFSLNSKIPPDLLVTILLLFLLSIVNFLIEVQYKDKS